MGSSIVFNGREYSSVDDMPPDVRQEFERTMAVLADTDGDGMPDLFEGSGMTTLSETRTRIVVNGQEYSSVDEMPPDVRKAYEKMKARIDRDQDGVPDMLETGGGQQGGMGFLKESVRTSTWRRPSAEARPDVAGPSSGGLPADPTDSRMMVAGAVIIVLLLIVAALVALLFFG